MNAPVNTFEAANAAMMAQLKLPAKRVTFFVAGKPKTNERARSRKGGGRPFTKTSTKMSRQDIVIAFQNEVGCDFEPWEGPVVVDVINCHTPPKSSKHWPGKQCRKKPDWDNSGKLVGDALNEVAWGDDAIITPGRCGKTWFHRAGLWVRITFCDPVPKPKHGRVKVNDTEWTLWDQGTKLGFVRKHGTRYRAHPFHDGCFPMQCALDPSHNSGNWRTMAAAEDAIRKAVGG